MRGHIDKWCKQNCDPATTPELNNVDCIAKYALLSDHDSFITMQVDTEVCEQIFSWLSEYKKKLHKKWEKTFSYSFYFTFVICTTCTRKKSSRVADLCKM